jgi:hypothetical protein
MDLWQRVSKPFRRLGRKLAAAITWIDQMDRAGRHLAIGVLVGVALGFLLGGATLIQGNQGTQHPAGIWVSLAVICLVLGALCLGVLVLLLVRARKRPKMTINAGTGWEYQFSTPPEKGMIDAIATLDPSFRVVKLHTTRLRVKETANVAAEDVAVRMAAAYPLPPDGKISFPAYLTFHEEVAEKKKDFAPGDRDYVGILHVTEMADGRFGMTPAFLSLSDPIVLEIEVLVQGKRAAAGYFSISGHMATAPNGSRIVSGQHPVVTEVPVLSES